MPGYPNLASGEAALGRFAQAPRWPVYVFCLGAVISAWVWLAFVAAGAGAVVTDDGTAVDLGPGMAVFRPFFEWLRGFTEGSAFLTFLVQLCAPALPEAQSGSQALGLFATMVAMWMMMSLAMMTPSAAPLVRTYCDIADTARGKGEPVISPTILVVGYLLVWLAFSMIAATVQWGLISLGTIDDPVRPVQGWLAAAILLFAGYYQFSGLKDACLEKCRNPFSTLFANWQTTTSGVLRLGVQQGLYCLGCCWALMLVMLVLGTMNLAWMALFTLLAILEKSGSGKVTSRVSGGILVAWGGILAVLSAVMTVSHA